MDKMLDHFQRALEWAVENSNSYNECPLYSLRSFCDLGDKEHASLTHVMLKDWCEFTQQELGENVEAVCKCDRGECSMANCWVVAIFKKTKEE